MYLQDCIWPVRLRRVQFAMGLEFRLCRSKGACRSYGSDHLELCFSQLLVIHIKKIRGVVSLTVALVSKYGEVDLSLH